jgi:hypothetical protein
MTQGTLRPRVLCLAELDIASTASWVIGHGLVPHHNDPVFMRIVTKGASLGHVA